MIRFRKIFTKVPKSTKACTTEKIFQIKFGKSKQFEFVFVTAGIKQKFHSKSANFMDQCSYEYRSGVQNSSESSSKFQQNGSFYEVTVDFKYITYDIKQNSFKIHIMFLPHYCIGINSIIIFGLYNIFKAIMYVNFQVQVFFY